VKTYVDADNLDLWEDDDDVMADACRFNNVDGSGATYYLLSPRVYACLKKRFENASKVYKAGRVKRSTWDRIEGRFEKVREWARINLDIQAVRQAVVKAEPLPNLFSVE
jgi:hypothetical protein